jgi:hypothetical protein
MRTLRLLLVAAVAAVAIGVAAPTASAGEPCWQRVILDWTKDGVITPNRYSPRCLRTAIKKTPEDLRDYSSIIDDINAALLDALAVGGTRNGGPGGTMGQGTGTPSGSRSKSGKASKTIGPEAKRAVENAGTPASAPGRSHPIPLPLILLASALAAAALAAGSPPLIKRFRTRFPRLRPAPGSVRPPA